MHCHQTISHFIDEKGIEDTLFWTSTVAPLWSSLETISTRMLGFSQATIRAVLPFYESDEESAQIYFIADVNFGTTIE
jgi:hypothetical protein